MFLFPTRCPICGNRLHAAERDICSRCWAQIPLSGNHAKEGNIVEQQFWGRIPIERADTFMIYQRGARSQQLVRAIKYRGARKTGVSLGRAMARQGMENGFFKGIDLIVPVPLARRRFRRRGYNQAEALAQGMGQVSGLPVVTKGIRRVRSTSTQTGLDRMTRMVNVEGVFQVEDALRFRQKHILLVDDVITTGATLISLAQSFMQACPEIRFSVFTLAQAASLYIVPHHGVLPEENEDKPWASGGHVDLTEG